MYLAITSDAMGVVQATPPDDDRTRIAPVIREDAHSLDVSSNGHIRRVLLVGQWSSCAPALDHHKAGVAILVECSRVTLAYACPEWCLKNGYIMQSKS